MEQSITNMNTNKLLLHVCCAACGAYVSQLLKKDFELSLYFYNSNIFPDTEHKKRKEEVEMIAKKYDLELLLEESDYNAWLETVKGMENEKEKGRRCYYCYKDRIEKLAEKAESNHFDYFTTTLSVSPHKVYEYIKEIGEKIGKNKKTRYYDANFKKNDGFKKSLEISRDLKLYRQEYCGCEFSKQAIKNHKLAK